jgi:hypothetical protein
MKRKTTGYILIALVFLAMLVSLNLIRAETELQPLNQNVDLRFLCTLNGAIPSASTNYNITISYPNGTTYLNNVGTTALGNGAFNYTTNFSQIGLYKVQMFCYNGTYSFADEGYYEVTNTGNKLDTSKTIVIVTIFVKSIFTSICMIASVRTKSSRRV